MHNYAFFDTETTSLLAAKDGKPGGEVIQFSAIITDKFFNPLRVINRYCNTTQLIDPGAFNTHKLSDKKVAILSDNKYFETVVEEERLRDMENVTWIAYNLAFDTRMVNQTLMQNGYASLNFGATVTRLDSAAEGIYKYDAMEPLSSINRSSHRTKLSTLLEAHIGTDVFRIACRIFRERYNIVDPHLDDGDFLHNAIFDVLGLSLLVNKFKNFLLK